LLPPRHRQTHESADDAVEESQQLRVGSCHPAERLGRFQTGEDLASRTGSGVEARLLIPPTGVRAFRNVERNADERALTLVSKLRAPHAERWNELANMTNQLKHHGAYSVALEQSFQQDPSVDSDALEQPRSEATGLVQGFGSEASLG